MVPDEFYLAGAFLFGGYILANGFPIPSFRKKKPKDNKR